ncbi:MAG: glycosyltransferase family 9 protein [Candidatus Omnitrophica bacterium]|nr:glycosyltransferase family 9 protein [Candidatus Omnitrophota bacterium]
MRRILFIRTDRLGETVLNLPAVAALKVLEPESQVTWLADAALVPLLQLAQSVDEVLAVRADAGSGWWLQAAQVAAFLRPRRFDVAIVSNPAKAWHLAVWLAGIPIRVGYNRKWGGLLTHRLADRKSIGDRHEVEYNVELIRRLGGAQTSREAVSGEVQWRQPRLDAERQALQPLLTRQGLQLAEPFIAIHPWTSNPVKQWPLDRCRALLQALGASPGPQLAVIGGPEQRRDAASVIPQGVAAADLVGRLTLPQLAAFLQQARLLVSNDSGPVHLAAAVNTKTIVLFGSSHSANGPRRWGPWGAGHTVITKPSMDLITVEEVVEAIRHHL